MTVRGDGRSPAWAVVAGMLVLVGAITGDARGTEASRPGGREFRWALGYAGGVVLRRDMGGGWTLDLSGGPDDDRSESDGERWSTGEGGEIIGPYPEHHLDTKESGWIRLGVGRHLAGNGRADLALTAAVRYLWSRGKTEETWTSAAGSAVQARTIQEREDADEWRVTVGLRQSFRLTERLSCETGLGVSFYDRQTDVVRLEETRDGEGVLQDRRERRSDLHDRSFFDFGWSGTASLAFLLWF